MKKKPREESKAERENHYKREFTRKWRKFIRDESGRYYDVRIRCLRKRDNLVLMLADGLQDYIVLRIKDNKQMSKLIKAFKNDDDVGIDTSVEDGGK